MEARPKTAENLSRSQFIYYLSVFAGSFAVPLVIAAILLSIGVLSWKITSEPKNPFPNAFEVRGPDVYVKVAAETGLNPAAGEDYLLIGWFKLSSLPKLDEKTILLSKIDDQSRFRRGILLAVAKDTKALRPVVYWQDTEGNGRWFSYGELQVPPGHWFMLALSFRKNRFLGLHAAWGDQEGEPKLHLMGGYDLEKEILPDSNSPLYVGSYGNGKYRGAVGPLGVFSGEKLSGKIKKILKDYLKHPAQIPDYFSEASTKVWIPSFRQEEKKGHAAVEFVGPEKRAH